MLKEPKKKKEKNIGGLKNLIKKKKKKKRRRRKTKKESEKERERKEDRSCCIALGTLSSHSMQHGNLRKRMYICVTGSPCYTVEN